MVLCYLYVIAAMLSFCGVDLVVTCSYSLKSDTLIMLFLHLSFV